MQADKTHLYMHINTFTIHLMRIDAL